MRDLACRGRRGHAVPMGVRVERAAGVTTVIAAISGYAVAGGLELALWCDLRVAESDAVLGVFCRRWGVPLIDGGTVRLPALIGRSQALDLILTGRPVPAPEAYEMGLANRIVPSGQARVAAEELAREIAAFPQECVRSDRLSALAAAGLTEEAALANEVRHGLATIEATGLAAVERFRTGGHRTGGHRTGGHRAGGHGRAWCGRPGRHGAR